jgi:MFS family permease
VGAGSIGATVNTIAGDLYDIRERGKVQGWLSSVWGVSAVVAPALGGVFAEYATWRWIFLVNLPLGIVALVVILRDLHEQVEHRRHRIDYAGSLLLLGAAGMLILGLLQGGVAWPWWSAPSILVFAAGVVCTVGATMVERRAAEPVLPPWLWRGRVTAGSYVATGVGGLLVIGLSTFLPTWGQSVLGLSAVAAGFMLAVMSLTWPLASGLSSHLYLRVGFRDTAAAGALVAVAAGVVFVLIPPDARVWQPVLGSALMGTGLGLIMSPLIVGLQSTVGWGRRGVVTGGAMFSRFLGQSIGAAVFGAITNAVLSHRLSSAPAHLSGLPGDVDGVSRTLAGGHESAAVAAYLRDALDASTHAVFTGLLVAGVVTLLVLIAVPRHFPVADNDAPPSTDFSATQPPAD